MIQNGCIYSRGNSVNTQKSAEIGIELKHPLPAISHGSRVQKQVQTSFGQIKILLVDKLRLLHYIHLFM